MRLSSIARMFPTAVPKLPVVTVFAAFLFLPMVFVLRYAYVRTYQFMLYSAVIKLDYFHAHVVSLKIG